MQEERFRPVNNKKWNNEEEIELGPAPPPQPSINPNGGVEKKVLSIFMKGWSGIDYEPKKVLSLVSHHWQITIYRIPVGMILQRCDSQT